MAASRSGLQLQALHGPRLSSDAGGPGGLASPQVTPPAGFLNTILERMPFPVKAIQVDGDSEFMAQFEDACRDRGIRLFVLPPRSPKLNGHVERAQRTHKEEFYYRLTSATTLTQVNKLLRTWEDIHNTYRPHQALGQITPLAFHQQCA